MALPEFRNASRRFDAEVAVLDVSLTIEVGESFTPLGPSGVSATAG